MQTLYKNSILEHPKSFYVLFFIKLFERFTFYGFQSIFIIYLVNHLNISKYNSILIFSSFSAIVYGFVLLGGLISDKILGFKKSIFFGLLILSIGYLLFSISINSKIIIMYLGMSFIAIGNGIFKTSPSSLINSIYINNKNKLDSAFTIYYMSINIGSFISMIFLPYIYIKFGWTTAFYINTLFSIIPIFIFIYFYKYIKNYGFDSDKKNISNKNKLLLYFLFLFLIPVSILLINNYKLTKLLLSFSLFLVIIKLFFETIKVKYIEKVLLVISYLMILEAMIFFILYSQIPTSLNFFAINHVNNKMFFIKFTPVQFQALNPMWIILLSPILSCFYNSKIGSKISITYKFSIGMAFCALSFLILPLGICFKSDLNYISSYWLLLSYFFQSLGELAISGLGLSMISKLIPNRLVGLMMGFWYLISSYSMIISGYITKFIYNKNINDINSIYKYNSFFLKIGIITTIISFIMFYLSYKLEKFLNKNNINI